MQFKIRHARLSRFLFCGDTESDKDYVGEQMLQMKINGKLIELRDCESEPLSYPDLIAGLTEEAKITVQGICTSTGKSSKLTYYWPVKTTAHFCLVDGGVYPPGHAGSNDFQVFLDKNISDSEDKREDVAKFFNHCQINPLFGCFERHFATFEEFKTEHDDYAAKRIAQSFSKCMPFGDETLKKIYKFRQSLHATEQIEAEFLANVSSDIAAPVGAGKKCLAIKKIVYEADTCSLDKKGIVFICALQMILCRQIKYGQPAREVLKLKPGMTPAQAMNGLADLRQIKMLALAKCLDVDCCLITNDVNLALLWAALRMKGVKDTIPPQMEIAPHKNLFSDFEMKDVVEIIEG